ncbi:hypothetical protein EVJ58_g2132 [Rhodofomes roseus]|uniref:histone deacetylase n=1 Tax=Rhodofomes roseus TaxID=34475 RepID=A0A4Y9YVK6_9APHY|nr:hypothetical protein EVJ58_g2132 [Rhodofomes roseus]
MEDANNDARMDVDDPQPSTASTSQAPVARASSLPPVLNISNIEVGYVYSTLMMTHTNTRGHHEEQPDRISRIFNLLKDSNCLAKMRRLPIRPVVREEALLVHSEALWEKILAIQSMTEEDIADSAAYYDELSLYVHLTTPYCAKLSAGGVIEAALAVARGDVRKSFAIVRPPGHHAEPDEHMGFCFLNNVSIAAKVVQLRTSVKRIMILDWDVHHGQFLRYVRQSVLIIQMMYEGGSFYPNGPFGSMVSCGQGPGLGYSVNIPWPERGMGDADYLLAFQKIVMPIALEFAPELVIISAGFDAAEGDTLGECHVSPTGYAHMTHMLSSLANGRLVVALEGGYNLDAISVSALAVARVILGEAPPQLEPMVASEVATETIWHVATEQSKYWKNIDPKACEPVEGLPARSSNMRVLTHVSTLDRGRAHYILNTRGNLRVELDSAMYCDVNLEHSYMVDCSKQLITWARSAGYALLDVNVYAKPFVKSRVKTPNNPGADVLTYLWDNYVQLTAARRVVLIGHGPGCEALMGLMRQRSVGVMRTVQGVVQVVGNHNVPVTPSDLANLRQWYFKNSLVFVPENHVVFRDKKLMRKHGNVMASKETKPIKLMIQALPVIENFVIQHLGPAPNVVNGTS